MLTIPKVSVNAEHASVTIGGCRLAVRDYGESWHSQITVQGRTRPSYPLQHEGEESPMLALARLCVMPGALPTQTQEATQQFADLVTRSVALVFDWTDDHRPYDWAYNWESGLSYAEQGHRVVAIQSNGGLDLAQMQQHFTCARDRFDDCFGRRWVR